MQGHEKGVLFRALRFLAGLSLTLIVLTSGAKAWADGTKEDVSLWVPVTLELPVNEKVSTSLQLEGRWNNTIQDIAGLRIIPGVEYDLNQHVSLSATYGWYPNFDDGMITNEHRLQQEVELSTTWRKVSVSLAQRLEERFIEGAQGTAFRTRTQLTFRVPLKNGPWYLVGWEDLRFNLNSSTGGPQAGFDQNRVFVGLGRVMGQATVEGGYQLRYANSSDSDPDNLDHILLLRLNYRLR